MVQPRELAARFEAYGDWRKRLALGVSALHEWLREQELADARVDLKVQQVLERLHQDKLVVAFVAEFSRGKSELINAIFFADFGARLLPTTTGRTTMCPTELLFDATRTPSIRLLPIETRLKDASVQEFRNYADEWVTFPLDLSDAGKMSEVLARVSEVKRVSVALARALGLEDDEEPGSAGRLGANAEDRVEVPCWRHAIINFPHPLLQQGLVILDTPGLNAVGTEPELTLSLLPSAQVVLFVLAADAGVTKTDLDVWKRDLAGDDAAQRAGRIVVLNKIDSLWDELKPEAAVAAEIDRQVVATAALLDLPPAQVFPVSAQKGLLAKVNGDDALLRKSRLPALEEALSRRLHSRQARDRRRGNAGRGPRTRRRGSGVARGAPGEHRRSARRAARIARQEPGRRPAHDGPRHRGKGALRARSAAIHGAAHGVHPADQRAVRRHRPRGACARMPGARGAASSAVPSRTACAARWPISSPRSAGISTTPHAGPPKSTT